MANLADLRIGLGVDLGNLASGFDKAPRMAGEAVNKVESKFKKLKDKLAPVAKAAGVAAGAAIVVGALEGIEREALGDKLAAQLNLNENESKVAGGIAGSLYANAYGDSLGQVNEAVGAVLGTLNDDLADPAAIESLSAKALDLASTFDLDVTDSVAKVGALLKGGLARDADHAMDLMAAAFQTVAPGLRDELGDATREYSKHFGDLGFTGEEAFGLLAAADDQFTLDKTGDAIKELSIRATDMSELSVDAFHKSGLSAERMAGLFLEGGDKARGALGELVDGLLGIEDPTEQANAAIALFGTPLEDLGTAQIPDFLASLDDMGGGLGDVTGRADDLGDTLNDNAKTKIAGWTRKVEGMLAKVVEAPGLLGDMAAGVAGVGQALQPVGPAMAGVGFIFRDQLSSMASGLGRGAAAAARWAASTVASAATAAASMAASAARQVAAWAVLSAKALLHAAKVAAAWLISMGPIGLIIAAIVGLTAIVVLNFDKIKGAISAVWNWVKSNWPLLLAILTGPFGLAVLTIVRHWDTIKSSATRAKDWVIARLRQVTDFVTGIPGKIKAAASGMWNGLKSGLRAVVEWILRKLDKVLGPLDEIAGKIGDIAGGIGGAVSGAVSKIPGFDDGGVVPGPIGAPRLVLAHGGETVLPTHKPGGGGGVQHVTETINLVADGRVLASVVRNHERALR